MEDHAVIGSPVETGTSTPHEIASTSPAIEAQTTETPTTLVDIPVTWRDSLPEEIRANKQLGKFDSLEKLAEGYINASSLIGKRMAEVDPAMLKTVFSPEEFAAFTKARGIPESFEGYDVDSFIPEAARKDERVMENLAGYKKLAHEIGLPAEHAAKLLQFELQMQEKSQEEFRQNNFASLTNTYGKDLSRADKVATRGAEALGGDELVSLLRTTGLASHPVVFKALLAAGEKMGEDSVPFNGGAASAPGGAADSAKAGLANLMKDPKFAQSWREGKPEAMATINALYARFN